MKIKLAGIVVEIKNRYKYTENFCKGFEADENEKADFCVYVPDDILKEACKKNPDYSDDYVENLEIYRIICKKALSYNAMIMHCASVCVNNEGYLFTAVSGTGKTTHISYWMKKFGDKLKVINGDKPIIRLINDRFYVCGTPWRGKENLGCNDMVPIKAICILERGEKNSIKKIAPHEAISTVITQTLRTNNIDEMSKMLEISDQLMKKIPFYRLKCNMSPEAADVSYKGMQ